MACISERGFTLRGSRRGCLSVVYFANCFTLLVSRKEGFTWLESLRVGFTWHVSRRGAFGQFPPPKQLFQIAFLFKLSHLLIRIYNLISFPTLVTLD